MTGAAMGLKGHIVMLPFMAHGHLIPFLALAREFHEETGFTITIANSPLNIQYLRSTISSSNSSSLSSDSGIHLAELSVCCTNTGLPPNTENTENLTLSEINRLCHASVSLEAPFQNLIEAIINQEGKPPVCIILDVFFGWSVKVARRFQIKVYTFTTCSAYGTAAYISFWLNLPHRFTNSNEFSLPEFPKRCRFNRFMMHRYAREADGGDGWSTFLQPQIKQSLSSDGWLCNTVEELEPLGLELLRRSIKLPVWAVGPLLPMNKLPNSSPYRKGVGKESIFAIEEYNEWLNLHSPNSVIYISFGSQNTISVSQMMALATGLEGSGKPFIWVIRPPLGFDINGGFREEWLPEGFEERMRNSKQGFMVKTWAPQLEILSHKSTGTFLSHCGWNSVFESLSQGVPIIGWPLAAEQAYNSKMLVEEIGVSVELTRTVESVISGDDVKKVIDMVMDSNGKGGEMKKKASEVSRKIRQAKSNEGKVKGSSISAMDDFLKSMIPSTYNK